MQICLAGPTQTPFEAGLFQIHLRIPPTYPAEPPKASFKTKIFHPNVDERTGDVCVDTLKRDWKPALTLKDVLVTIRCLLVYPNPTSSLNEAAGKLLLEDYEGYARHARLMTGVHAGVPEELKGLVEEARRRGEDEDQGVGKKDPKAPGEQKRKIKQAVKPSTTIIRKDKGKEKEKEACSDSEGGDSGKENAETRRFVARPASPLGKRSMDEAQETRDSASGIEKGEDAEDSGRKSPKLREGQSANSRSPLTATTTTTTATTTTKKEIIIKKDSTKKPAASGKSNKTGAAARKVGLKRF